MWSTKKPSPVKAESKSGTGGGDGDEEVIDLTEGGAPSKHSRGADNKKLSLGKPVPLLVQE